MSNLQLLKHQLLAIDNTEFVLDNTIFIKMSLGENFQSVTGLNDY